MEQQNTHNTTIDGVSYTTHPADWRPIEKQDACTVYTVHFHHLPSGANLTVECPTLDVAQCVWDALSKSSTITLSTSRPTL